MRVAPSPRKYGEAKRAWEANEECRKGCGRRPNGRTYGSWKVHEVHCKGDAEPKSLARGVIGAAIATTKRARRGVPDDTL